jgi:hypothetical protein
MRIVPQLLQTAPWTGVGSSRFRIHHFAAEHAHGSGWVDRRGPLWLYSIKLTDSGLEDPLIDNPIEHEVERSFRSVLAHQSCPVVSKSFRFQPCCSKRGRMGS